MKFGFMIVLLTVLSVCVGSVAAQNNEKEKQAVTAASQWLSTVDSGRYEQSWDEAAQLFKEAVSEEAWVKSLSTIRRPLAEVVSREVIGATYRTSLPGAPDGEYVVIRFKTRFENKRSAIETATPMLENDGRWRVSGYFIK